MGKTIYPHTFRYTNAHENVSIPKYLHTHAHATYTLTHTHKVTHAHTQTYTLTHLHTHISHSPGLAPPNSNFFRAGPRFGLGGVGMTG